MHLVFPQMSTAELLAYLADELEGADPAAATAGVQASIRRIERFLAANSQQGRHAVLVIDEAHLLDSVHTFEALRLLLNFEPGGTPALTLLLVGQPAILPTLDRMPQWEERLGVKCLLRPFSESETAAYVEHRLRVAGADAIDRRSRRHAHAPRADARHRPADQPAVRPGAADRFCRGAADARCRTFRGRLPRVGGGGAGIARLWLARTQAC